LSDADLLLGLGVIFLGLGGVFGLLGNEPRSSRALRGASILVGAIGILEVILSFGLRLV
jgi:hypothetical protein